MPKRGFLEREGIVRNAIKEDVLYFAIPGVLVFTAGILVSAMDGFYGLFFMMWELIRHPDNLYLLSIQNFIGLVMLVSGLAIAIFAQITLWRFYSSTLVIREDHQLVTHGIYRYTRHPIYLGVITAMIGIPVTASSFFGLLIMSVMIPIFLYRIKMEERLLIEEFGDAYRKYKETTSKLIPFIF